MNKIFCAGLLLAFGWSANAQHMINEQEANRLRVLTYNVRNGVGMDDKTDLGRVAKAIEESGATIVAVQEVDSMTRRSGKRYVLGELGALTLMHPYFAPAINFDGGKYGIGLLSKERPKSVKHLPLPGREEERTLMVADFGKYRIANAHLSLTEEDALASVAIIEAEAKAGSTPFVVMGDWNNYPDSPTLSALKKAGFKVQNDESRATWPADKPKDCIDYVAVYQPEEAGVAKVSAKVLNEPLASDHRPVLTELHMKMQPEEIVYHKPYLQNPMDGGMTIMFQTRCKAQCSVEYGADTLELQTIRQMVAGQEACHDIEHRVRLENLVPGQKYYYRVRAKEIIENHAYKKIFGDEYLSPFYSFTMPAEETTDFTALILNDLHECQPTIEAWRDLADFIEHDFVILNGDCLPEPSSRDHAIKSIHELADAFNGCSTPLFFIRGNHEIRNAYSSGMPSLLEFPGGKTYGAFNWGDTRIVVLDCGEDKPDDTWVYYGLNDFTDLRQEQADFLAAELAGKDFKKSAKRVLIHHIPIWGNGDEYQPCTELWAPLFQKAQVNVDIAGHNHKHIYHARGTRDNPMPVVIGGGYEPDKATLMVLSKKGKILTLRVLNTKGEEIFKINL